MQGWYRPDSQSERLRVRLSVERRSLVLHNLAGALAAQWSLDHLENRAIPVFGRDWIIGDRRLPGPTLVLENDRDYAVVRGTSSGLLPLRERIWRQVFFWPTESGNLTNRPVLIPVTAAILVLALWWLLQI